MKKNIFALHFAGTLLIIAILSATGCSKKTAAPPAAPPVADNAAVPTTPAPEATAPIMPSTDVAKSFADADAAMKAKAYDKAAQALIAAQMQKNLTDQQAAEARNRMAGLQQSLAQAIANGDANARAAAEIIRQAHTVH